MPDRITPYRIDVIVAKNASVHFEMLDESIAIFIVTSGGIERHYSAHVKGRKLIVRLVDEFPAPANQPGET